MLATPDSEHLRYFTSTTASLFGLYGVVIALVLQMLKEGKFMGLAYRVAVSVPIFLLAAALLAGLGAIYRVWVLGTTSWCAQSMPLGILVLDTTAVLWIAVMLATLIFKIGRS